MGDVFTERHAARSIYYCNAIIAHAPHQDASITHIYPKTAGTRARPELLNHHY